MSSSGSSISNTPLFGRAWQLSVKTANQDPDSSDQNVLSFSGWDPESLRIRFNVLETTLPSPWWFAEIDVYNCSDVTAQNLLRNAVWVTLKAGYQAGDNRYAIIWDGPVLQVMFDKENVVDQVIKFNCMAGPWLLEEQFFNRSQGSLTSQADTVSTFITLANGNYNQQVSDHANDLLIAKKYPRGKTIFGSTSKYIRQMSDDNFIQSWMTNGGDTYLSEMLAPNANVTPDIIYSPPFPPNFNPSQTSGEITRSIIGVPKQTPFGCEFTVLLDPRLKVKVPPLLVKLDQTLIQQLKVQYGQALTWLDQSGTFVAAQIRHVGDSRGNEWYSHVTGYQLGYAQKLLDGVFLSTQGG